MPTAEMWFWIGIYLWCGLGILSFILMAVVECKKGNAHDLNAGGYLMVFQAAIVFAPVFIQFGVEALRELRNLSKGKK